MRKELNLIALLMLFVWAQPGILRMQERAQQRVALDQQPQQLSEEQQNALMVVSQVADAARSFADPFRGAVIRAEAADILWGQDEVQARVIFQGAFESLSKLSPGRHASDTEQKQFMEHRRQAQQDVLKVLARHDPQAAEQLNKQAERLATESATPANEKPAESAGRLVQMARELVADNPEQALRLGVKSLEQGEFDNFFGVLILELAKRDKSMGHALAMAALDVLNKPGVDVTTGLQTLAFLPNTGMTMGFVTDQEAKRLLNLFMQTLGALVLNMRQGQMIPNQFAQRLYFLAERDYLPAFERIDPERAPELRLLADELSKRIQLRQRKLPELSRLTKGQIENFQSEMVQVEQETDVAIKDLKLRALALNMTRRAQWDHARQAAANITDLELRKQTKDDISLGQSYREMENKRFEDAHHAAMQINSLPLRARMTAELARRVLSGTANEVQTRTLLEEVYTVARSAEDTVDKIWALTAVANMYSEFDKTRTFQIYVELIQSINRAKTTGVPQVSEAKKPLATIGMTIGGGDASFSTSDRIELEDIPVEIGIRILAQQDYYQTVTLAASVKHEILRARMQLAVCRGVLAKKPMDKEAQKQ